MRMTIKGLMLLSVVSLVVAGAWNWTETRDSSELSIRASSQQDTQVDEGYFVTPSTTFCLMLVKLT